MQYKAALLAKPSVRDLIGQHCASLLLDVVCGVCFKSHIRDWLEHPFRTENWSYVFEVRPKQLHVSRE
jgi:hypothetical protein